VKSKAAERPKSEIRRLLAKKLFSHESLHDRNRAFVALFEDRLMILVGKEGGEIQPIPPPKPPSTGLLLPDYFQDEKITLAY